MSYDEQITGTEGNDTIDAGDGRVRIESLGGNDAINIGDSLAGDYIDGGDGWDSLMVRGTAAVINFAQVDLNSIEQINIETTDWSADSPVAIPRTVILTDEIFDGVTWQPSLSLWGTSGSVVGATQISAGRNWHVSGTSGGDQITDGSSNMIVSLSGGDDTIDGGPGQDEISVYLGNLEDVAPNDRTLSLVRNDTTGDWELLADSQAIFSLSQPDVSDQYFLLSDLREPGDLQNNQQFYGVTSVRNVELLRFDVSVPVPGSSSNYWFSLASIQPSFLNGQLQVDLMSQTQVGTDGDDVFAGTSSDDHFVILSGNDQVSAGAGNDNIDVFDNGATDTIEGGAGSDQVKFMSSAQGTITLGANLVGIEHVVVETSADAPAREVLITDSVFSDVQSWSFGVSVWGSGDANIRAQDATNRLSISGGDGNDLIQSGSGGDWLSGWAGNDTIAGGDGHDWLAIDLGLVSGSELDGLRLAQRDDGSWVLGKPGQDWFLFEHVDGVQFRSTDLRSSDMLLPDTVNVGMDLVSGIEQLAIQYTTLDGQGQTTWIRWADIDVRVSSDDGLSLSMPATPKSGTPSDDTIIGTRGYDNINALTGVDVVLAGAGNDTVSVSDDTTGDRLDGGSGLDRLHVVGVGGTITLGEGIRGFERFVIEENYSNPVPTTILLEQSALADVESMVRLEYWGQTGVVIDASGVTQALGVPSDFGTGTDLYLGGDDGSDLIIGSNAGDLISPGRGDDTVNGGGGNDSMTYRVGTFTGVGQLSDIALERVSANHWNVNFLGSTWFEIRQSTLDTSALVITDVRGEDAGNVGSKLFKNIETLLLTGTPDQSVLPVDSELATEIGIAGTASDFQLSFAINGLALLGSSNSDRIVGTSQPEALVGLEANDTLIGGGGNDSLDGGSGNDYIVGGDQIDGIFAGVGDDYVVGSLGNDRIIGFYGYDTVSYREAGLTSGLDVDFALGLVTYSDSTHGFTDELISVETLKTTDHADTIDASDFGLVALGNMRGGFGLFNSFEPGRGNDTIEGNGSTLLRFRDNNATSGITVDLQAGTAQSAYHGQKVILGGVNSLEGTHLNDSLKGGDPRADWFESYRATLGSDTIDGGSGSDRVEYDRMTLSPAGLSVALMDGAGTVTGKTDGAQDTLRNIESIRATQFDDVITVMSTSTEEGLRVNYQVEGGGGNDTITGSGFTSLRYSTARAGVHVDIVKGISQSLNEYEDANVGSDLFSGINGVIGSAYSDLLVGGNPDNPYEIFRGAQGDDTIDGGEGWDIVQYMNGAWSEYDNQILRALDDDGSYAYKTGIHVALAAGIVRGDPLVEGTDTLRGIEDVRGTVNDDVFDARGFGPNSVNAGSGAYETRNSFRGGAGDDTVYGNGDTRIDYRDAKAALYVDLEAGVGRSMQWAVDGTDAALVGVDSLFRVNSVLGGNFSDYIAGGGDISQYGSLLSGFDGNDTLIGGLGMTIFDGGAGNDSIVGGNRASVARYSGNFADFDIVTQDGKLLVSDVRDGSPEGNDILENINVLKFDDRDYFVLSLANRSVLVGDNGSYNVSNGDIVVGTRFAEQFNVPDQASPFVFASTGDCINLWMPIHEYNVRAFGNQLHLADKNGNNTVFVNVAGPITVATTTGEAQVSFDFTSGTMLFGGKPVNGIGFDAYEALSLYTVDPADDQWFPASGLMDIPSFSKGTGGDVIAYTDAALSIGGGGVLSADRARIDQTTGKATFSAGSGLTLEDALSDIAQAMTDALDAPGEIALFKLANDDDYNLFISDGHAGVTDTDVVLKLGGLFSYSALDLSDGQLALS